SFEGGWYVGQPVMVTVNDYGLGLYNGDTGVVVARDEGGRAVVFGDGDAQRAVSPSRLADLETVFAMTVHKAQGSEFEEVAILVPDPGARVLSRELLYTAVTRARARVMVVATEASVRAAVGRPVARASGLTDRLWSPRSPTSTA
ncbi:MAG TPA: ATP-binding domain-containing protein, partial [Acidimicrobiales bacterium]|nr:ATP-binding domain-containing protein [Acidimicrobiales bacterium]